MSKKIKNFKNFVIESGQPADDFVAPKDDDKEVKELQPRSKGEQEFANMHKVEKVDYAPYPGQDHVFNGTPMKEEKELEEGLEDKEDNPANRQHLCAKNVVHEKWGEGNCISEEHAEPDSEGNIEWYDVMFKHGLETKVPVDEMKVVKSEKYLHASKKKVDSQVKEEVSLDEGKVLKALENIVKKKQASNVRFGNGKNVKVDMTTANAIVGMMKKLKPANQKKAEDMLEKSPEGLMKLMDVAFGGKR